MSDDVTTAATIASLRAEVERLTAELHRRVCELGVKGNALDERNAYAERLLSENVRLSNEVCAIGTRSSMDAEDHAATRKELDAVVILLNGAREALDTARERVREWNVLVAQGCTPGGSEFHDTPQNVARYIKERTEDKDRIIKSQQRELNKARSRAGVLEREVKAWRDAYNDYQHSGVCDEGGTMNEPNAVAETDRTHALDAAKFGGAT